MVCHCAPVASALVCDSHSCRSADMNTKRYFNFKLHIEIKSYIIIRVKNTKELKAKPTAV
jgi:hypothetical protein